MIKTKINKNLNLKYQTDGKLHILKQSRLQKSPANYGRFETKASYEDYLSKLNFTDLQKHAISAGEVPIDNRKSLELKLVKRFMRLKEKVTA